MARRESHAEVKMHAVQEKADAAINEEFTATEIVHSWSAGELVLDVKDVEGNWRRFLWIPADDTEIAGVRELA